MTKHYMKTFREARQEMGFTHTSAYVPTARLTEFSLFVDRLKAERMLEICETCDPHSGERRALAGRNVMNLPTPDEAEAVLGRHPNQPAIKRQVHELMDRLISANSTMNVAKASETEDDALKMMSWAVAHNHMANVLWRELVFATQQLESRNG